MGEKSKDVVFRRINGRIVPIRRKVGEAKQRRMARSTQERRKSNENKRKASAFITSGFGISILGGSIGGKQFGRGVRGKRAALDVGRGSSGFGGGMEGTMAGARVHQKAVKRVRFGRKSAFLTQLAGGALIGEGITKLAVEAGFKESDTANIVSGAAGEVAAFSTGAAFKKAAKGQGFRSTFRSAAKIVARKKFKIPL